jgi:hypothetical protein
MVDSDLPALPPNPIGGSAWLKRGPSADNIEGEQRAAKRAGYGPPAHALPLIMIIGNLAKLTG